jgi:hypothetical protein
VTAEGGPDDAKKPGAESGKDGGADASGRYLLVMARFNESLVEKPQLEPLPEVPGAAKDDAKDDAKGGAAADAKDAAAKESTPDAAESLKKADEAEAAAQAAIESRRRVERENRRKQDDYDDKVKAAQKRVRDLNGRFADWYYVVSDKEYAKIHLGRGDVVKKADAKSAEAAAVPPVPSAPAAGGQ